jgi:hypothetical protein
LQCTLHIRSPDTATVRTPDLGVTTACTAAACTVVTEGMGTAGTDGPACFEKQRRMAMYDAGMYI